MVVPMNLKTGTTVSETVVVTSLSLPLKMNCDGQTMVLGGLLSEDVSRFKDKVPILGDLPLVGKLFRSEQSQTKKKNLVIFVTPTILDPAGNRLHTEEDMPFQERQSSVPSQR